jgi:hypothetical protein
MAAKPSGPGADRPAALAPSAGGSNLRGTSTGARRPPCVDTAVRTAADHADTVPRIEPTCLPASFTVSAGSLKVG